MLTNFLWVASTRSSPLPKPAIRLMSGSRPNVRLRSAADLLRSRHSSSLTYGNFPSDAVGLGSLSTAEVRSPGMVTVRGEDWVAVAVMRPQAIVHGTIPRRRLAAFAVVPPRRASSGIGVISMSSPPPRSTRECFSRTQSPEISHLLCDNKANLIEILTYCRARA